MMRYTPTCRQLPMSKFLDDEPTTCTLIGGQFCDICQEKIVRSTLCLFNSKLTNELQDKKAVPFTWASIQFPTPPATVGKGKQRQVEYCPPTSPLVNYGGCFLYS